MTNSVTDNAADVIVRESVVLQRIDAAGSEPIRAEIFSLEHLEAEARSLAAGAASSVRPGVPLLRRFFDNRRELVRAHRIVTDACRGQETVGTDAE
jgi:hypothetical protein